MGSRESKTSVGYRVKKSSIIDDYIIKDEIIGKGKYLEDIRTKICLLNH